MCLTISCQCWRSRCIWGGKGDFSGENWAVQQVELVLRLGFADKRMPGLVEFVYESGAQGRKLALSCRICL